ncbi:MAG: hypothetical protein F6K22_35505 [Okeania sp. SIO2F4]|uniref:hypothetical protein n=1 Tax=Okeania sp. SIO2F4 TaxID=2607790 RepID=UPI00142BECF2|nr:hypothetical protein [Okeania sp. SIO2F4]NES07626.1 hypothetical protein [Okeania sp. SIO2F4]
MTQSDRPTQRDAIYPGFKNRFIQKCVRRKYSGGWILSAIKLLITSEGLVMGLNCKGVRRVSKFII